MLRFFGSLIISSYNRLVGTVKALGVNPSLIGENGKVDSPAKKSK
jgi:hypothetical protein